MRRSENAQRAHEIYDEIKTLKHPFLKEYLVGDGALVVADRIRRLIKYAPLSGEVTISVKPYTVFVGTRQKSRTEQLVDMVRKLSLHVDDESLYEEARRLVEA